MTPRWPAPDPGRVLGALILSVLTLVAALNAGGFALPGAPTAISAGGAPTGRLLSVRGVASITATSGDLLVTAGNNLTSQGAQFGAAGKATVLAGNSINLGAVTDTLDTQTVTGIRHGAKTVTNDLETVRGTSITAGGDITVAAGLTNSTGTVTGDAVTIASTNGNVLVSGVGGVSLDTSDQHDVTTTATHTHSSGFLGLSHTTTNSNDVLTTDTAIGSLVSGNNVQILSTGGAINIVGSTVAGTSGVTLAAQGPINILDAADTSVETYSYSKKTSGLSFGLSGGGFGISIGTSRLGETQDTDTVTSSGSLVGATNGPVTIASGGAVLVRGSQLVAGAGDLDVTGKTITVENGVQTLNQSETTTQSSSGLFIGVTGGLVSAAVAAGTTINTAASDTDPRAQALQGIAGARDLYNLGKGIAGAVNAPNSVLSNLSLVVGFGASSSQSNSTTASLEGVGSSLSATGNVNLFATGGPGVGALTVTGSTISGTNITAIADTIALNAAANTLTTTNSSSSNSWSLGVALSTQGGVSLNGAYSQANGNGSSSSLTHTNSVITATDAASLISAGNTTLNGGEVHANDIQAQIGGDLTITSLQDTATQTQHDSSFSVGGSLGLTNPAASSFSLSASQSNANGAYKSVTDPSGLFSGNGGAQVNVGGTTTLTGGFITSSQQAANDNRNSLTTGSLVVNSLANSSTYSASTEGGGISVGFAKSAGGALTPTPGANGISPAIPQNESGSASSVTPGGVTQNASGPTITVANPADQATAKTLAAQSVGLTTSNVAAQAGVLAANPNLQGVLAGQQQLGAAEQAAAPAIAQTESQIADALAASGNSAFAEGQPGRAALQAADGALLAGLGGGNALGGATGSFASAIVTPAINTAINNATGGPTALGNLVTSAVGDLVGAAAGGGSGASTAGTFTQYNLLGPHLKTAKAAELAQCGANQDCIAAVNAQYAAAEGPGATVDSFTGAPITITGITSCDGIPGCIATLANTPTPNPAASTPQASVGPNPPAPDSSGRNTAAVLAGAESDSTGGAMGALALAQLNDPNAINETVTQLANDMAALRASAQQAANDATGVTTGIQEYGQGQNLLMSGNPNQYANALNLMMNGSALMMFGQAVQTGASLEANVLALMGVPEFKAPEELATVGAEVLGAAKTTATAADAGAAATKTGTVWDSITATQPVYPGTNIPISFTMQLENGQTVWVAGNATEHMAEYASGMANNMASPAAVNMATQAQLTSLEAAVNTATTNGIVYNQTMTVGGWELTFAPPRLPGQLPSLIHALPTH